MDLDLYILVPSGVLLAIGLFGCYIWCNVQGFCCCEPWWEYDYIADQPLDLL